MLNRRLIPFLSLIVATACSKPRHEQATTPTESDCYACHGSTENGNPAPPPILGQPNAPKDAHQSHLHGAAWHGPVSCDTCHPVPTNFADPLHLDNKVEVTFDESVATSDGANPQYSFDTHACTNTYCHGTTLSGGRLTTPQWFAVGEGEAQCGNCHSIPPTENHPKTDGTLQSCSFCHGNVIDGQGNFIAPELHVNGKVDFAGTACDSCHGSNGNPAPPPAINGSTDTTDPLVGAHRRHTGPSTWHATVSCSECHKVPTTPSDPGHYDPPQLVVFGPTAKAMSTSASFDTTSYTCTVYCHGPTLPDDGGTHTTPVWTQVTDQNPLPCDTCHGNPPGGQHPPRTDCASCHDAVIAADGTFTHPELHIDGTVNVKTTECNLCHGNAAGDPNDFRNWAPPVDTHDRSDETLMSVGTHQEHLAASTTHAQVPCSACHLVPISTTSPGHIDNQVTITYAFPATANSAPTSFDADTGKCTNWCHGSGFQTPNTNLPVWNQPVAGELPCTSCHGYPPALPHPPRTDCASCHMETTGPNHINGTVDVVTLACNTCHGNAAGDVNTQANWAPPVDAEGHGTTDFAGVGAHQLHLGAGTFGHRPVICSDCHTVWPSVTAPGHIDGQIQLTWSDVAAHGTTPSFSTSANTCSGVYCHGAGFPAQGAAVEVVPTWVTAPGGSFPTPACGSQCHGFPPAAPHPPSTACSQCHGDIAADGSFITPALHINGSVDF